MSSDQGTIEYLTAFLINESEIKQLLADTHQEEYRIEGTEDAIVLSLIGNKESRRRIRERFAAKLDAVFFCEENVTPAERLVRVLDRRGMRICTAESCTGGLIAARITDVPGSSRVFWGGFVVYDNAAKQQMLGVRGVEEFGAVSAEVVTEMATQAVEKSGANVSIAVSGIAGPGGGTTEKPVGTVHIGIGRSGRPTRAYKIHVPGDRERVRRRTSLACLILATGEVLEKNIDTSMLSNYI